MRSFLAGVATTIVVLFVSPFVSLFALGVARGFPQAVERRSVVEPLYGNLWSAAPQDGHEEMAVFNSFLLPAVF
jgi:hypothetical protein